MDASEFRSRCYDIWDGVGPEATDLDLLAFMECDHQQAHANDIDRDALDEAVELFDANAPSGVPSRIRALQARVENHKANERVALIAAAVSLSMAIMFALVLFAQSMVNQ